MALKKADKIITEMNSHSSDHYECSYMAVDRARLTKFIRGPGEAFVEQPQLHFPNLPHFRSLPFPAVFFSSPTSMHLFVVSMLFFP